MPPKTSQLALTSLVVFVISTIFLVLTSLFQSFFLGIFSFPAFFISIGMAVISLFLILIKRRQLKGVIYPSIVLILSTLAWVYPPFNPLVYVNQCPSPEKEIFYEFSHYQNKSLYPEDREGPEGCVVNFYSHDSPDQILEYYREQLQSNGWNFKEGTLDSSGSVAQNYILAESKGFSYSVSASGEQITEVRIGIQKVN